MKIIIDHRLPSWYVCFSNGNNETWLQKILKKGFRHVRAFAFDPVAAVWVIFDPGWDGILIRAVKDPAKLIAESYRQGPVLLCKVEGSRVRVGPRILVACTSQICHLLGVNLFVHTPFRLFCALKKRGATELLFED